jgi:GH43 family beta-xylosidase
LSGTPVKIAAPTFDWETRGHSVNEGPAVLQRHGKIFITYSASATDANYCIGLLTADAGSNLMDPASWTKTPSPVMASSDERQEYGPGHNSFTVDELGNDVIVYHARSHREFSGESLFEPNRHARARTLQWTETGTPRFWD